MTSISRLSLRRTWLRLAAAAGIIGLAGFASWAGGHQHPYYLSINWTASLPNWAFLVECGREPRRGDLIEFIPPENAFYKDVAFVKRVVAVSGDKVACQGRHFLIDGSVVATAKETSQSGVPLERGPCGVVPDGHVFVLTPHPDGFDSRYKEIGYVALNRVRGVAHPIL